MPTPEITSSIILGFSSYELLIRGAIEAGLADIRKKPYLLNYMFSWYVNDTLTNQIYGEKARQAAINWVLNTEIFISLGTRLDLPKYPLISIVPRSSIEDYSTLADVNTDTQETVIDPDPIQVNPNIILGPFNTPGYSYDSASGTVTLPSILSTNLLSVGMILYDVINNNQYPILTITSISQFTIASNASVNLQNAYIGAAGGMTVTVKSCMFRESYDIYCFAQNSSDELYYLETLVQFILLKYKEPYLEGRGFDRTTISLGPVSLETRQGVQERLFFRVITLNGYNTKYWPAQFSPTLQGFNVITKIDNPLQTSPGYDSQVGGSDWEMSEDKLIEDALSNNRNIPGNT
jgi:hypothetical protein